MPTTVKDGHANVFGWNTFGEDSNEDPSGLIHMQLRQDLAINLPQGRMDGPVFPISPIVNSHGPRFRRYLAGEFRSYSGRT